jgi:hypothetical protein
MKVVYVGNYQKGWCTEVHIALTLQSMGHEVIRVQENELRPGDLLVQVRNHQPDFVLWTSSRPGYVTQADLDELRHLSIPTVSYHLDLYVGLQRQSGLDTDPFWRTDCVFTPDGDPHSAEVFKAKGINHHWLKPGVYDAECVPGKIRDEFRARVAFIGKTVNYHPDVWPYRAELISFLRTTYGSWFAVYGSPFRTVRDQDLNDVLASTDIIIGDTLCPGFTHQNYWSDRVYETTGRGGFMIHPRIKGLEDEFIEHEEIAFYNYGDFDHLKKLIDWYLEHADYREAVRLKGMNRTKRDHTYRNRLQEMFAVLKEQGVIQ